MKVSVVVTVLNERESIEELIKAIWCQTRKPEELVIVDGGSSDGTVEKIRDLKLSNPAFTKLQRGGQKVEVAVQVYSKPGSNIAEGRNFGIARARGEIVAVTDAGCVPEVGWLKKLVLPIEGGKADVVAGFYRMRGTSELQLALAPYLGVVPQRFSKNDFLPSSRSVAFTREVWRKVGGYPESLSRTAEDTVFNLALVKIGARLVREPQALVDWQLPKNLEQAARKFFDYAKGDAEARIWWHPVQKWRTHLVKIVLIFVRYLAWLGLFLWSKPAAMLAAAVYVGWVVWKNRGVVDRKAIWWCPVIQMTADIAVMAGAVSGLLQGARNRPGRERSG